LTSGEQQVKQFLQVIVSVAAICSMCLSPAVAQKTQNSTDSSANSGNSDRTFLNKAMESNIAEIELARMAQMKSQNAQVKDFAAMMIKDHSDALNRLRQAASLQSSNSGSQSSSENPTAGITLSKEHQQLKDRLVKLSGSAFDREYINAMVQEHQKDIREFENEANANSNATGAGREKPAPIGTEGQPQALARDILPTLKMHLEEAQMLQRQMAGR